MALLVIFLTTLTGCADQMTLEQAQTTVLVGFGFGSGLFNSTE